MAEGKAVPWTDAEKLGILFQIIEKAGTIPYDELVLPPGRTKKAVTVMISKEKIKVQKELQASVRVVSSTEGKEASKAAAPKKGKRKADGDADEAPKNSKAPRKKKTATAGADAGDVASEGEADGAVKAESDGDELPF